MVLINVRKHISIIISLALFITDLCDAREVDYSLDVRPELYHANLEIRQLGDTSSSCILPAPCSPSSCINAACYLPGVFQLNETLEDDSTAEKLKKRFPTNPTNIGSYLQSLARRADSTSLVPALAAGFSSPSFCTQMSFFDLPLTRQTIIGMGMTELTGCTILCVVSARAVYMCHIWEDLSFAPVNTMSSQRFVGIQPFLNLLSGNGGNTVSAAGPALDPTLFNGGNTDNTRAFIMTPRFQNTLNDAESQEHAAEITQLAAVVRNLIPGVGITMYNYVPARGTELYNFSYQGVALWQYDPNSNGRGNANWRLWFEGTNENGVDLGQDVI